MARLRTRPRRHHRSPGQDRHGNRSLLVPPGQTCPVCDDIHPACSAHLVSKRRLPSGEIVHRKSEHCICTYTDTQIVNETDGPCPYHDLAKPVPCREASPARIVPGTVPPRCKIHAGNPVRGPAHPMWKHGDRAKPRYLPSRYIDTVDRLRDDPEFGTLVPHVLLCEARIEELLRRLDTDSVGIGVLPGIRSALADLRSALADGDTATIDSAISSLEESTRDTDMADSATWKEIIRMQSAMRKLVDAETKRKIVVGEYVHRDDVRNLAKEIITVAAEYIPDEASRGEFTDKIMARAARANMAASAHIVEHYPLPERPALPPGLTMNVDGDGGADVPMTKARVGPGAKANGKGASGKRPKTRSKTTAEEYVQVMDALDEEVDLDGGGTGGVGGSYNYTADYGDDEDDEDDDGDSKEAYYE